MTDQSKIPLPQDGEEQPRQTGSLIERAVQSFGWSRLSPPPVQPGFKPVEPRPAPEQRQPAATPVLPVATPLPPPAVMPEPVAAAPVAALAASPAAFTGPLHPIDRAHL